MARYVKIGRVPLKFNETPKHNLVVFLMGPMGRYTLLQNSGTGP